MTRPRRSCTGSFAARPRAGWRASPRPGGWRPIPTRVTLVRPLLAVSRDEIRDYLCRARPTVPRGSIQHRSHADPRPHPPRPVAQAGERVQPQGRRGTGAAGVTHRIVSEPPSRPTCASSCAASVITKTPHAVVLKHPYLSSIPSFLRAEVLRRVWRSVGWPEAGMSAKRWRRLAALAPKQGHRPRRDWRARHHFHRELLPSPATIAATRDRLLGSKQRGADCA